MASEDWASALGAWLAREDVSRSMQVVGSIVGVLGAIELTTGLLPDILLQVFGLLFFGGFALFLLAMVADEVRLRGTRPSPVTDGLPPEGPPPVPWVSEHVWRTSRQWTRFPGLRGPESLDDHLLDVQATEVEEAQHGRVPRLERPGPQIPSGNLQEHQARLDETPLVGAWWNPAPWPVCCDRLARIVLVNPTGIELSVWERDAGPLDHAVLEPAAQESWSSELEDLRAGGRVENGVNVFHCSACGRLYGVYSHT